jgi:hypothetical protein
VTTLKRFIIALIAGAAVFSIAFGAAAALSVNGGVLQAGDDGDVTCTSAVAVEGWGLETDADTVLSVRISGFANACFGADAFVRLTDGTGSYITGNLTPDDPPSALNPDGGNPIDENEERFAIPGGIDPEAVEDVHVWIEGGGGTADD